MVQAEREDARHTLPTQVPCQILHTLPLSVNQVA